MPQLTLSRSQMGSLARSISTCGRPCEARKRKWRTFGLSCDRCCLDEMAEGGLRNYKSRSLLECVTYKQNNLSPQCMAPNVDCLLFSQL